MIWMIVAAALVVAELLTGTLYLVVIAGGTVAGGLAALACSSLTTQFIACGTVALLGLVWLKKVRLAPRRLSQAPPSLDLGQPVEVIEQRNDGTLLVNYRGSTWDAVFHHASDSSAATATDVLVVKEVRGSQLVVGRR